MRQSQAEFTKAAFTVLRKNYAKTKEGQQAFVGWPRNACLGDPSASLALSLWLPDVLQN
jgi:hypothetical protein